MRDDALKYETTTTDNELHAANARSVALWSHVAETDNSQSRADVADFTFEVSTEVRHDFRVISFRGREELSHLPRFRVRLCSDSPDVDPSVMLGKNCRFDLVGCGYMRTICGIVTRFERVGDGNRLTYYLAEFGPAFWRLTRGSTSRVFTEPRLADMTVPGAVRRVFDNAGMPFDSYRFALAADYQKREMITQYRENDWNFVSRLMEREGIFHFFEPGPGGARIVLADDSAAHVPSPHCPFLEYRSPDGLLPADNSEHVFAIREAVATRSRQVALDDYDFRRPGVDLFCSTSRKPARSLMLDDFPGEFDQVETGQRYARSRLEAENCRARSIDLLTTARGLSPGYRFTLTNAPAESLCGAWLVTRVEHRLRRPQGAEEQSGLDDRPYVSRVSAIPALTPFRPLRRARRPFVQGSQTALVVGPEGEEIYTDRYGRVKIQFHWDHEGRSAPDSSCWVRVSQGSAGGQYGMMFLPRVGHEVIVDFLEGNPDRPIVTGRVYNGDLMPPYPLPDEKTKSVIKTHSTKGGGGTNEIRFDDMKGAEQVLHYAQKDLHVRVNNDRVENVDHDRHLTVGRDRIERVERDAHCNVQGNAVVRIDGARCAVVAADACERIGGMHSQEIGETHFVRVGRSAMIEAGDRITLKVGSNFIRIDRHEIVIRGAKVKVNCAGARPGAGRLVRQIRLARPSSADRVRPGADLHREKEQSAGWRERARDPLEVADALSEMWDTIDGGIKAAIGYLKQRMRRPNHRRDPWLLRRFALLKRMAGWFRRIDEMRLSPAKRVRLIHRWVRLDRFRARKLWRGLGWIGYAVTVGRIWASEDWWRELNVVAGGALGSTAFALAVGAICAPLGPFAIPIAFVSAYVGGEVGEWAAGMTYDGIARYWNRLRDESSTARREPAPSALPGECLDASAWQPALRPCFTR